MFFEFSDLHLPPQKGVQIMDMREKIIAETTDMFMKYGIKTIRMDDIASRLGMSKRTIYEHFEGGREALIRECVNCYYNRLHSENEKKMSVAGNVIEQFMVLINDWDNLVETNMNFQVDLQRFYPALFKEVADKHKKEGLNKLKIRLRQGIDDGLIMPGINLDFAAAVLIETMHSILSKPSSYEDSNISFEQAFKYVFMFFFRGISTPKGIHLVDELMWKNQIKERKESKR